MLQESERKLKLDLEKPKIIYGTETDMAVDF